MDDPNLPNPGQWVIVKAVNGADRLVMRLRTDRPVEHDIDSYSTAVLVNWKYPHRPGMPPPEDVWRRMQVLDESVADLAWEPGCAYLMNICTGLGAREWCYYTKDRDDFMRRFNELLAAHERYPLEIEFHDDPQWEVWQRYRSAYERVGGNAEGPPGRAS